METKKTLRDRGICVVIPTYNNAGTIADVVRRALEYCLDVIVVADGCTDQTLDILQGIEEITVVCCAKNGGKGSALKRGFKQALQMGFAYAITLDADGQHFPEDIPTMLQANQKHPGALIVGERRGLDAMERSKGSKFANAFANFWFAIQTGRYLKDTQTGFRLYPLKKIHGLSLLTSRYEAELELLVFASWHGVEIVSEPVNVYYPLYGLPLAIWRGLTTILRTIYSLLFFLVAVIIANPIAMLYSLLVKDQEMRRRKLHQILCFFARLVTLWHGIPGVKFSVGNPHEEDFHKPAIIICNHQSHLDLMIMLMLTPKLICLTKDWVWNNPFYGYIIRNAEFYPVSEGTETLMPKLQSLVERGYSIAVYPEGTRSQNCSISRFHQGAFHLAQQLELDVLPLILYGAGKALPKKGKFLRKWPIRIELDKRLSPAEMLALGDTPREQASQMRKYYKRRYAEMANRIEQDV